MTNPIPRIFQIGAHRIVEDVSTVHLTNEQIRDLLKSHYPEVAHATINEHTAQTEQGEVRLLTFLPQPGRKG